MPTLTWTRLSSARRERVLVAPMDEQSPLRIHAHMQPWLDDYAGRPAFSPRAGRHNR
ncbi:hypothetical protein ABZ871_15345 [Streptomyces populi]